MRGLFACVAVALVAAVPAMGYNATISISTPGSVLVGDENQIAWEDLAGPNFYVDISITSDDPAGMSAFGITLTANAPIDYLAMENYFGNALNYQGQYASYASRPGGVDHNWSMATPADAILIPAGTLPMGGPLAGEEINTINETGTFGLNGLAVWMSMVKPAEKPIGDITITDERENAPAAYVGDSIFQPQNVTVIPLVILPEPVSALLLLVGAAFLRRR